MVRAFSLVELSIVLVILGLLTGGVLSGQNLIRAAELRSVTTDIQRFQAAIYTFRSKYDALPGDMRNATAFWGQSDLCAGADSAGVCDGDGSNTIASVPSPRTANTVYEALQAWRHLAKAGLIEGEYTGATNASMSAADSVVPMRLGNNHTWLIWHMGNRTGAASGSVVSSFALDYGNTITSSDNALSPTELWNIDKKTDDGLPASGFIIARSWSNCTTATDRTEIAATYLLDVNNPQCLLILRNL
jgi:prepilin-type N-terminal cleavage/methylation domain-containing protein